MNILFVCGIFPPDIGGPSSYVPAMANSLISKGHSVAVITFSDNKTDNVDKKYSFPIIRVKRRSLYFIREIIFILKAIKLAFKSDLIYANGNNFKAHLISMISRKPIVHKIVGDTAWERAQNKGKTELTIDQYQTSSGTLTTNFYNFVRNFPLQNADLIITPSHYLSSLVKKWAPKAKIQIIYNSFHATNEINDDLKHAPYSKKNLVMIGRLVTWKGINFAIQTLKELPDYQLLIVGDGPSRDSLQNLAKALHVESRVNFVGLKKKHEVYQLLKKSYALIINSSYEGLPHIALEAFHLDIPVIATNVGGNTEVIKDGETGFLTEYGNILSLKAAILKLELCNRQAITSNAKKLLNEKFSYEKMIHETESCLEAIASK